MNSNTAIVFKFMRMTFHIPLEKFEFSGRSDGTSYQVPEQLDDFHFSDDMETLAVPLDNAGDIQLDASKNETQIFSNKDDLYTPESSIENYRVNELETLINTRRHVKLHQVQSMSSIEFLADTGKISKHLSKGVTIPELIILINNNYDYQGTQFKSTRNYSDSPNDIKPTTEGFSKEIFTQRKPEKRRVKILRRKASRDEKNTRFYMTSTTNYYFIKFLNSLGYSGRVIYTHSEFEYIPFLVQVFFHVPLILTAIIVLIIILTFDPELSAEMIREEISKLPEEVYEDCDCKECTICLDNFNVGEKIRILPCKHQFHTPCIDNWLLTSLRCPICRKSVSSLTETPGYELYRNINIV